MSFIEFFQAHQAQNAVYVILFVGMFFDGALFILAAVFLLLQHALKPAAAIPIIITGALLEQVAWYWVGKKLSSWTWLTSHADKLAASFDHHLLERPFHTLVISKFVYGIHRAILIRAGMLNLQFKKYIINSFLSVLVWLGALAALGSGLGASYEVTKKYLTYAEVVPLVLIVVFIVIERFLSSRLKKEI